MATEQALGGGGPRRRARHQRLASGVAAVTGGAFLLQRPLAASFAHDASMFRPSSARKALLPRSIGTGQHQAALQETWWSAGHGKSATASASSTGALSIALTVPVAALAEAHGRIGGNQRAGRTARRATSSNDVDVSAEIRALQREAQKLRDGAAKLEAAQEAERAEETKRLFKEFDADGSGAVDVDEVIRGLHELDGTEIDREHALKIIEACDINKNGVLEPEEFDVLKLKAALTELQGAERAAKETRRREEVEQLKKEILERQQEEIARIIATVHDTSFPVRLASILAYALPLVDCVRVVRPELWIGPDLLPVMQPLVGLAAFEQMVPFSGFVVFVIMQVLSSNRGLPRLLRYNLRQAITLELILIIFPYLIFFIVPSEEVTTAATAIFAIVVAVIGYVSVMNLLGKLPRGVPALSSFTESTPIGSTLVPRRKDDEKK